MSEGLNRVMLIGNLVESAELRMTNGGQAILKMRIACNERFKDKSGEWKDRAEFVSVVLWGKRAEALSKFLDKGNRVFVEGSLRTSSYEDREGNKRYKTEVNASNVILCGGRGEGGGSSSKPTGGGGFEDRDYGPGDDDQIPFASAEFGAEERWVR